MLSNIFLFLHCRPMRTLAALAFLASALAFPAYSAADTVLILRSQSAAFATVDQAIRADIRDEITLLTWVTDAGKNRALDKNVFLRLLDSLRPKALVLMDNTVLRIYQEYQAGVPQDEPVVPAVCGMGLFLDLTVQKLRNAAGVAYEAPIVTTVLNLRAVAAKPLNRIGVVHRSFMKPFIEKNREYCVRENIELVIVEIPNQSEGLRKLLEQALYGLVREKKVDALWVPNDNVLLNVDLVRDVWKPIANDANLPVIVGIEGLVTKQADFGVFAVLPDNFGIGSQMAQKILECRDNGWRFASPQTESPLSVYKIINLEKAFKLFPFKEKGLESIDKVAP